MTQQEERIGEIVNDRYHLGRELARTEVGVVFEGKDVELKRSVAVEVASSIEEPKARRKWMRDAMIAQQLVDEHVLRILDVGESRGVPFVVREIATRTLAEELEDRGVIPIPEAVGWMLDACEAIAEAHAHGIAHGDVRVENIYLVPGTAGPIVKVAWTSAAKAERAAREDVARDVAGLGAMLRVLATGRAREDGEDHAPTLPNGLAHAVARALAQAPEGGFHSIAELARTLAPYSPPGHPAPRNIARILSRTGIVSGAAPPADLPRTTEEQRGHGRRAGRASFTDERFGRTSSASHGETNRHGHALALVSFALLAAVVMGTWLLWDRGMLPSWSRSEPTEAAGTTELTSGPWSPAENAVDLSNAAATDPSLNPVPGATEPPAPREEDAPPADPGY